MEDKTYYGNQPKEIDEAYIDQLLSTPAVPKKAPVPPPEPEPEPEPVADEPPAPAEPVGKAFPKPLLILIAIALLGVGFLLGWLARGDRQVPGEASTTTMQPTYTWIDIDTVPPDIAVDYAAMSTKQLTDIAIQIRELNSFAGLADYLHLTVQSYEALKSKYPVLAELEQRPDAVEQLTFYNLIISSSLGHPAATALIEYYVNQLGFPPATSPYDPPIDPGIAEDYTSMATLELVSRAAQIPGLAIFGSPTTSTIMTTETYDALKRDNPVLLELELRPDAVEQLTLYALSCSNLNNIHAVNALISYYVTGLGFPPADTVIYNTSDAWIRETSDVYTVYEHTEAPLVTFLSAEGGNDDTHMVFDFGVDQYVLSGGMGDSVDEANFWFRIELKQNAAAVLANEPRPALEIHNAALQISSSSMPDINGNWAMIQPYEGGWFVYGYAFDNITATFSFHPNPGENTSYRVSLPVYPQPGEDATAKDIAEYILLRGSDILAVQQIYGNLHYDQYPPLKRLLDTDGGISALLNLTQTKYDDFSNLSSVRPTYKIALDILSLPAVFHHMTEDELAAFNVLKFRAEYFTADSLLYIPIRGANSKVYFSGMTDYHVGDKPAALAELDVDEMNCWFYVPMTQGSQILRQENWTLEAALEDGNGVLGVWELYDSATDRLVGWIVSGKLDSPQNVQLQLKQGDIVLETQRRIPQLFYWEGSE